MTRDLALVDAHFLETRAEFGLPVDEESMQAAVKDSFESERDSDPLGVPLTEAEYQAALDYAEWREAAEPLVTLSEKHSDVTSGIDFGRSILVPTLTIAVTDRADERLVDELAALVPGGFSGKIDYVDVSTDEIREVRSDLTTGLRKDGESTLLADLSAALPVAIHDVGYRPGVPTLTLIVDDGLDEQGVSDAAATVNEVARRHTTVRFTVRSELKAEDGANRLDSPGQAKGGLRIQDTTGGRCTTGFSVRKDGEVFVLTNGHCRDGGADFIHQTSTKWVNYGDVDNDEWAEYHGGPYNPWYLDYAYIESHGNRPGLGSHYIMVVSSTSNDSQLVPIHSLFTGNDTGRYTCYEGASRHRGQHLTSHIYRTLCGWFIEYAGDDTIRTGAPLCHGDSGGPQHSANQAYGLATRLVGASLGPDCRADSAYVRLEAQLSNEPGSSLVTSSNPVTNQLRNGLGKCISADSSGIANWTVYLQWTCSTGYHYAKSFTLEPVPDSWGHDTDHYHLVRYSGSTRYCLSVNNNTGGGGTQNYARVHSWKCSPTSNGAQVWELRWNTSTTNGYFELRPDQASSKCLSVYGSSSADGAVLHLWTCHHENAAQQWRVW